MQKNSSTIIIILLLVIIGLLVHNNCTHKANVTGDKKQVQSGPQVANAKKGQSIDQLTKESVVIPYVKNNGKLPSYYITKKDARAQGWNPATGNLCDVLPGKAIGGDIFTNREGNLPVKNGRTWFEADLNYSCEHRNADRLLFSNDGLVFVTHDHYKTFEQK